MLRASLTHDPFPSVGNATDFTLKEIVEQAPVLEDLAVWGCISVTRNHPRRKNLKVCQLRCPTSGIAWAFWPCPDGAGSSFAPVAADGGSGGLSVYGVAPRTGRQPAAGVSRPMVRKMTDACDLTSHSARSRVLAMLLYLSRSRSCRLSESSRTSLAALPSPNPGKQATRPGWETIWQMTTSAGWLGRQNCLPLVTGVSCEQLISMYIGYGSLGLARLGAARVLSMMEFGACATGSPATETLSRLPRALCEHDFPSPRFELPSSESGVAGSQDRRTDGGR